MAIPPMGAAGATSIWYVVIKSIILLILGSLTLAFLSKQFKTKDTSFMTALKVNLVIVVISFIWTLLSQALQNPAQPSIVLSVLTFVVYYILYIVLAIYLIKKFYHVNMSEAVSIWILFIITYLIVNVIFSVIQISLQMKALTAQMQMMQPNGGLMPTGQEAQLGIPAMPGAEEQIVNP